MGPLWRYVRMRAEGRWGVGSMATTGCIAGALLYVSSARLCGLSPGTAYDPGCMALGRAWRRAAVGLDVERGRPRALPPPLSVCTGGGDGGARTN